MLPQPATEFPMQLPDYMTGPMTTGQRALFLCRAGALLPRGADACPCCSRASAASLHHVLLECDFWAEQRAVMWRGLEQEAGADMVAAVQGGAPHEILHALLTADAWGSAAGHVCSRVQRFLAAIYRFLAVSPSADSRTALGKVDNIACQACHRQSGAATLLLCDGCGRGYHTRCLVPALPAVPVGDWFCVSCVPVGAAPVQHVHRRSRREGPWPSG